MFYLFRQNNSGGSFKFDEKRGISVEVWVEADSAEQANERAEAIGLYFDGLGDCECCGCRWYEAYGDVSDDYSVLAEAPTKSTGYSAWHERSGNAVAYGYLHRADGTIEPLPFEKQRF